MKPNVKISVIIPIYNVEKYLDDCMKSVVTQSLKEIEIICVDDCSTDCSMEVLEKWMKQDERIILLHNTENQGQSISRNEGLLRARGEYIFYLDSDDTIVEDALEEIYRIVKEKEYDLVLYNFNSTYESDEIKRMTGNGYVNRDALQEGEWNGQDLFCALMENDVMPSTPWQLAYKKKFLLDNNLFFQGHIIHEDIPYVVKAILLADYTYYRNKQLYNWHRRMNSTTTRKTSPEHVEGRVIGYISLMDFWKKHKFCENVECCLIKKMNILLFQIREAFSKIEQPQKIFAKEAWYKSVLYTMVEYPKKSMLSLSDLEKIEKSKHIIIYGAGRLADLFMRERWTFNKRIIGVAVSEIIENERYFWGYPILAIDEFQEYARECLVIVAVCKRYQADIRKKLDDIGFTNVIYVH